MKTKLLKNLILGSFFIGSFSTSAQGSFPKTRKKSLPKTQQQQDGLLNDLKNQKQKLEEERNFLSKQLTERAHKNLSFKNPEEEKKLGEEVLQIKEGIIALERKIRNLERKERKIAVLEKKLVPSKE